MPNIVCDNVETCPGTENPLGNFSSEAPDPPTYIRLSYPWLDPNNPVGGNGGDNLPPPAFFANGCTTLCESQVSQEDADLCAARAAYICSHKDGPTTPPVQFFYNTLQVCNVPCPDGSLFSYRVFPGAFVSTSQAAADEQAAAYACQQAGLAVICLSSIATYGCPSSSYFGFITSEARGRPPFTFTLVGGAIPPGLTFSQVSPTSATISGTPTVPGNYSFVIQMTDANGSSSQRTYSIAVIGIVNFPPVASTNQPYDFTFAAFGGVAPYTFEVDPADMPDGLVMDSTGHITGTPTKDGTFAFDITVSDSV